MKKTILIFLMGLFYFVSCQKHSLVEEDFQQQVTPQTYVKTRGATAPALVSNDVPVRPLMAQNPLLDELGAGYDILRSYPLVNVKNITYMVVDVDKLYKEINSQINVKKNYTSIPEFTYFENTEKYAQSKSHKLNLGISVNAKFLKMLNLSVKSNFDKMFSNSSVDEKRSSYSEIEMAITTKDLTLNLGSAADLSEKYATPSFKFDTYNLPPQDLVATYGGHILRNYTIGGRAFGVVKSETRNHESSENKSRKMSAAVKATFKTILNKSEAGFNTSVFDTTAIDVQKHFSYFEMAFCTFGGNPAYGLGGFLSFQDPQAFNVNLKSWGASVVDDRFAQLQTIYKDGLTPIYRFVREENIRKKIVSYLEYGNEFNFGEPRIDRFILNNSEVYTVLVTRWNNKILFDKQPLKEEDKETDPPHSNISARPWWIKSSYPFSVYPFTNTEENSSGISIKYYYQGNFPTEYCGYVESHFLGTRVYNVFPDYDFRDIDKNSIRMRQIKGDATGMMYLTFTKGNKSYALGVYRDFIKTLYAIHPDVKNLSIETVNDLTGYTVIGL